MFPFSEVLSVWLIRFDINCYWAVRFSGVDKRFSFFGVDPLAGSPKFCLLWEDILGKTVKQPVTKV